ncbi:MAG: sulfatase [Acidobacteriia bacterium]|nr:sulfatase [Terriglobia bacterium]
MTRRTFLGSAMGAAASAQPDRTRRPNIVFVSVDDMNDWVGCLRGYPGVQTPNIDRLARRGVLFANAHCASPLCNPSRTALLTGRRPSTTGIYNNDQFWRPNLPGVVTIPQYFKQNGYTVAGAGKVFHHTAGCNPPDQWDEFQLQVFDDPWYRRDEWYPWNKRIPNPLGHPYNGLKNFQGEFDWGVLPKEASEYGDQKAVDYGQRFLARKHEKPFFLAVGLWHPHIPMFSPRQYYDLYPESKVKLPEIRADDLNDIPAVGREFAAFRRSEHERIVKEGKWKDAVRSYLAAISFADAMVGALVRTVEQSAYGSNTVLVFWSDNGWHLGEKQHWHKSTLWQRSTHVPLIISAPGMRGAGKARNQPVNLLDLYPTLVELCGLPGPKDLDGESLAPLLRDPAARRNPTVSTYLPNNHAVRNERWRYIRYSDGGEELYDCVKDPNEFTNLAGMPEHAGLKRDLAQWMPKASAASKPERDAFDFDFATYTFKPKRAQ